MKKEKFYEMFWLFIIASIFGYFIEGLYTLPSKHMWYNHSAVVLGPFDFAYGIGAVLLTLCLYRFRASNAITIFAVGFLTGTIAEYIMSWGMEWLFGFSAWDYSQHFLNINGRVSLLYSVFWGLLSILWLKFIYPLLQKFLTKLTLKKGRIIAWILIVFLIFDSILSINAVLRANAREKGIPASNKYEEFLDKAFPDEYLSITYSHKWGD